MKHLPALALAAGLTLAGVMGVHAQAAESIWLAANTVAYQAGDTVVATVNGQSATLIQGFTFQIRYDPACLKPVNAASPISGMNGLFLPQNSGLVDASFASTTPLTANGVLAEVRFLSVATCQTNLVLQSAALAIRNQSGYAAPLGGIVTGTRSVALNIGPGTGAAKPTQPVVGTPLPLGVETPSSPNLLLWGGVILLVMLLVGAALFGFLRWSSKGSSVS
jgi:cohesin domain-containing protein